MSQFMIIVQYVLNIIPTLCLNNNLVSYLNKAEKEYPVNYKNSYFGMFSGRQSFIQGGRYFRFEWIFFFFV